MGGELRRMIGKTGAKPGKVGLCLIERLRLIDDIARRLARGRRDTVGLVPVGGEPPGEQLSGGGCGTKDRGRGKRRWLPGWPRRCVRSGG
jgi:hypothetical protein